jgi:tetrapyrrole methylase family protein/MazG family protein
MLTALCRKLLDRHTHIFGENHADTPEEALVFWAEAKKKEKKYTSNTDAMSRVPKNFPALLYAEKVQKIAKKCGFDWDNVDGAVDKVREELDELLTASPEDRHEEAGDLLFAVCNVLRFYKIDNEMALHDANRKFVERFKVVEELATRDGKEMTDYTLQQLDEFWNEAKRQGK